MLNLSCLSYPSPSAAAKLINTGLTTFLRDKKNLTGYQCTNTSTIGIWILSMLLWRPLYVTCAGWDILPGKTKKPHVQLGHFYLTSYCCSWRHAASPQPSVWHSLMVSWSFPYNKTQQCHITKPCFSSHLYQQGDKNPSDTCIEASKHAAVGAVPLGGVEGGVST